ncbi:MAG: hypothetical protein LBG76_05745 [Treponema sp.]|jgi:hypothetical protein|nr:hypothetical protein [Treponema sp.]
MDDARSAAELIRNFKSPPRDYSALAFWFWNGTLEKNKLVRQIDEMSAKGVHGAFMHARAYLKTPYLEDAWWEAVEACVERGRETGFHPWLYDEYAWPSGTAGSTFDFSYQKPSRVLARGEQNMAKGLEALRRPAAEQEGAQPAALIASFPLDGGETLAFFRRVYPRQVDYLNKDTIKYFIELTHGEYKKRHGRDFGGVIPGIFFDEIYLAGPLPWTDTLPEEFKKRCGYDLLPCLPSLVMDAGDFRTVRGDYYRVIAELYEEAFFRQIGDWCEENRLMLTGHTEEYLAGHPARQGNYFNTIRRLHIPGADCHDYRYRFPRKISCVEPKYSVSAARAYGKERAMSEAMGGAGWGCSLQQFKRGINTLGAMGISMFILHGFYYESEHQGSQADWPASFFYQNPYWKYFKIFGDYMSRISSMNAAGDAVVDVGLYYPIYDMQINTAGGGVTPFGRDMNGAFHRALYTLLERQIDTDLIDAGSLCRGEIAGGIITTGRQRFKVLLFPANVTLPPGAPQAGTLADTLKKFIAAGGHVIFYQDSGVSKNGASKNGASKSDAPCREAPEGFSGCPVIGIEDLPGHIDSLITPDILVLEGSRANLYACHRRIGGRDLYFVSNSSPRPRELKLQLREAGAVLKLDIETGEALRLPSTITPDHAAALRLSLGEDEACYLLIEPEADGTPSVKTPSAKTPVLEEMEETAVPSRWKFLPLDKTFDNRYGIDADRTELEIPLAEFSSGLHDASSLIRICNMEGESGFCGRHLSLWEGRWIARRPSWICGADRDLYFRRIVELEARPEAARICFAAVNHCVVSVNGAEAGRGGKEPVCADIAPLLKPGRNLIAAHVHNDAPDNTFTAVHELPPDNIIAFLFEAELAAADAAARLVSDGRWIVNNRFQENWLSPEEDFESAALRVDPVHHQSPWGSAKDGQWYYAWERGAPPLHPWGDLPLFGKKPAFPLQLHYGVTVPAGTARIKKPPVRGTWSGAYNGKPLRFEGDWAAVANDGRAHHLDITVRAEGPEDGLTAPVTVSVEPFTAPLADWRLYGYPWFSGRCRYENSVWLDKKEGRYIIDLGQVHFSAEVWVNGGLAGVRVWNPYRLDITDLLREGENRIAVVAANSAAVERRYLLVDEGMALGWNRYWNEDNIDREAENLVSGFLGPARIFRYKEVNE